MRVLTLTVLALFIGFLVWKRETHINDRNRSAVMYYNVVLIVVVGGTVLYAVLS